MATGSEVQHALGAAEQLGDGVRVVSLPCLERFERQSAEYIESILPLSCTARVAVEAGVSEHMGQVRRPHRQDGLHRPLRNLRARRCSHGSTRYDC